MIRVKYDLSRVPRDLLEKYVDMMLCITRNNVANSKIDANSHLGKEVVKAAEVPLRTRSEVNADIVNVVRNYAEYYSRQTHDQSIFLSKAYYLPDGEIVCADRDLKVLLTEETSD